MNKVLVVLTFLLVVSSCGCRGIRSIGCPAEVEKSMRSDWFREMGYPLSYMLIPPSQESIDAEQERINRINKWKNSLRDRCLRAAYEEWIWYYELELDRARDARKEADNQKRFDSTHKLPKPFEKLQP